MDAADGLSALEARLEERRRRTIPPPSRHGRLTVPAADRRQAAQAPVSRAAPPEGMTEAPADVRTGAPADGSTAVRAAIRPSAPPAGRSGAGRRRRGRGGGARRYTVDLEVELHRSLHMRALLMGVDASEVIRILIELLSDAAVADLVTDRLEQAGW